MMMREYQVRFCEGLGVKFPGPTRRLDAALGLLTRFIPDYPPPIPIAKKYRKPDWL